MTKEIYLLFALVIGLIGLIGYFINKKLSEVAQGSQQDQVLTEWLKTMQSSLDNTTKTLNSALSSTSKNLSDTLQKGNQDLNQRLDNAARLMSQIQKDAGRFAELSLSMKNLQDYLKSPKLRGNIGEEVLKDLISQMFPKNSFFLQYSFKSGDKVDAAIKTDAGILPIDSKFPAENFQKMLAAENDTEKEDWRREFIKDVKKHITDISKKYILPEEGTMDFALMYIPSEPIYYEVVNLLELTDFARKNRVYPVSPNTLYANLQVILLSFQGKEIEKRTKQVFVLMRAIQKDYTKITDELSVLNRHITNSYNQMANVNSGFALMGQKLSSTQALGEIKEEKGKGENRE
ncbi:MAG: DNA recombination protein RmuC [Microgenomates group bacterium ADurb.Bin219]|nr:MAG: DNA recombination protein RmuC [Microgenomates group bacterium ADurb.Bin219]HNP89278.1 DNA recombination protein RmuC [Candidatus Woesebacteria bacterium]